jgi:hypothetical protein
MKKIIYVAMGLAIVIAVACKKNMDSTEKPLITTGPVLDTLVGTISVNSTVTRNCYLFGLVYVAPGVTLTINPGVTIYGSQSTITTPGTIFDSVNLFKNKGILCVQAGAKLIAQGTCAQPIIWTSDNKIAVGSRKFGDWGGLILYGNAPIHKANGATSGRFEAFDIVPNDLRNFYGGTNASDNSGVLTYNRLEFGGGLVTEINKEINGLTLCGIGNGTTINHIEVIRAGDDGIEWFGGNVNADHLLSYGNKDDDFDFDEGYNGNLQFIVAVRDTLADNSGSHLLEVDNDANASTNTPFTAPFISNATLIGPAVAKNFTPGSQSYFDGAIQARRRTSMKLVNSYVIANAMPYGLVFTPTTGDPANFSPVLDPPSLALPGIVQAFNIFQTNNAGFAGVAVSSPIEGNPVPFGLVNNPNIVNRLVSPNNANNGLTSQSDFNLGACLENTSTTPFLHTGTNLAALGLPFFTGTDERGGVISTDSWLCACAGWISIATQ